jgi:NhaP-type Na+/H+ and K+/H+ antiporter
MKRKILQVLFAGTGVAIAVYIAITMTRLWSDYRLPLITSHEKFVSEQMVVFVVLTFFLGMIFGYAGFKLGTWVMPKKAQ